MSKFTVSMGHNEALEEQNPLPKLPSLLEGNHDSNLRQPSLHQCQLFLTSPSGLWQKDMMTILRRKTAMNPGTEVKHPTEYL